MRLGRHNRCGVFTVILFILFLPNTSAKWFWESDKLNTQKSTPVWTTSRKLAFREKVRDLWLHAFENYMQNAYPMDELRPLSCIGRGPSDDPNDWVANDVAGNFSVTLIDALDTFVVLNDRRGFAQAVQNVINAVHSFDLDTRPQVFETNIRVLGGLLSAHQFASNSNHKFYLKWYKGELLRLAYDLGNRLLPAFKTPTGIPYARVLHFIVAIFTKEIHIHLGTAGAGSLIIEFGILSRLTRDPRFEDAAYKAFFAIWNRRSDIGLVGNTINAITGAWLSDITGIGAGSYLRVETERMDTGEVEFLDVWLEAYSNIMRYHRGEEGYWFRQVNMKTGALAYASADSLSSFWSGLQVLAGDVQNAIKSHLIFWNIWRRFSAIPEVFDLNTRLPSAWQYPIRPEFIESTYYLYRATRDSLYLDMGERVLNDIIFRSKVDCGLASIENILTNKQVDRMESFVLSETLKYLYLLFDEDNVLHSDDSNTVFTTEGHLLTLPRDLIKPSSPVRRQLRRHENLQCPAYFSTKHPTDPLDETYGLAGSIRTRQDTEFARLTVGLDENSLASLDDSAFWFPEGWCELPKIDIYSFDFVLSPDGSYTPEDPTPSPKKIYEVPDGYVIMNMTGIRAHLTSRLDGRGYDITRLGPFAVHTGQMIYLNDSNLNVESTEKFEPLDRESTIRLHFGFDPIESMSSFGEGPIDDLVITAFTSLFGSDPYSSIRLNQHKEIPVYQIDGDNPMGCFLYPDESFLGSMVVVARGECTFLQKLVMARAGGAIGVIVVSDDEHPINPTADKDELALVDDHISNATLVVITLSSGEALQSLLSKAAQKSVEVVMSMEKTDISTSYIDRTEQKRTGIRYIYVNNRPILNIRLLV
ncbi:hypothetical protein Clacol_001704 [Clathrus columnatus]|uniref:alpha-1,2-Mannosidase n=1 Tax=Clathrus columnatus TaxID=1419009 RepID=A0AAV4ZYU1_9AGAM|nr:hypothetical protein Clacol_001704 [Clathrus columnatus]